MVDVLRGTVGMKIMTYCANKSCPFNNCDKHLDNAPKSGYVTIAWLDGVCRDYIGWIVDEASRETRG